MLPLLGAGDKAKRSITRAHIVVEKGGKVSEVKIGVKSGESVPKAMEFVEGKH